MRSACLFLLLLAAPLAGCRHFEAGQKSGTELGTDARGRSAPVTYVTPEDYARMTPAERLRLNAQVGVQFTVPLSGGPQAKPRYLTDEEVREALGK